MKNILVIGATGSGKSCFTNLYLMEKLSIYKHYFYNILDDESLNFIAGSNINMSNPAFAFWLHFRDKDFSFVNLYDFLNNDFELSLKQNIELVNDHNAAKMFVYYKQSQFSRNEPNNYFNGIIQMLNAISGKSLIIMDEIFNFKFLQTCPCDKIVITQTEKLFDLDTKTILSTFNEIWLGSNINLKSELYKNMKELFVSSNNLKFIQYDSNNATTINPILKVKTLSKKPILF